MKKMIKLAVVAAGVFAGISAHAASSASWTVTGTVTPSPCNITLSGSGAFDFGTMARADLAAQGVAHWSGANYYDLGERAAALNVTCPSPTKFAIHFVDAKAGTDIFNDSTQRYGMGTMNGTKIGAYNISYNGMYTAVSTVGGAADPIVTIMETSGVASGSSTWAGWAGFHSQNSSYAFSKTAGATTPDSLVQLDMPIKVLGFVNADLVNSATTDVNMAGAGTVSIVML